MHFEVPGGSKILPFSKFVNGEFWISSCFTFPLGDGSPAPPLLHLATQPGLNAGGRQGAPAVLVEVSGSPQSTPTMP